VHVDVGGAQQAQPKLLRLGRRGEPRQCKTDAEQAGPANVKSAHARV
jgi:hypothetical protein